MNSSCEFRTVSCISLLDSFAEFDIFRESKTRNRNPDRRKSIAVDMRMKISFCSSSRSFRFLGFNVNSLRRCHLQARGTQISRNRRPRFPRAVIVQDLAPRCHTEEVRNTRIRIPSRAKNRSHQFRVSRPIFTSFECPAMFFRLRCPRKVRWSLESKSPANPLNPL